MKQRRHITLNALAIGLALIIMTLAPSATAPRVLAQDTATATATSSSLTEQLDAAWSLQDWVEVLRLLDLIEVQDPSYSELEDKRYFAYVNYGYELMTQNKCTESLSAFRNALLVRSDGDEAEAGLELLERYCTTPIPGTATPTTPASSATSTPVPSNGTTTSYTVQSGDTLYSLAKTYGVTVQEIMQANGLNSYFIRTGQTLIIPAEESDPTEVRVHIVQPGETLFHVANQYDTTVSAIMSLNGLTSYSIWAYQALYIPAAEQPDMILHTVAAGETLYSIAKEYGVSLAMLMKANGLENYTIYIYQQIAIPPEDWSGDLVTTPTTATTHLVVAGDTLFSIARTYGTTVTALKSANGLGSSTIYAGDTLRIP